MSSQNETNPANGMHNLNHQQLKNCFDIRVQNAASKILSQIPSQNLSNPTPQEKKEGKKIRLNVFFMTILQKTLKWHFRHLLHYYKTLKKKLCPVCNVKLQMIAKHTSIFELVVILYQDFASCQSLKMVHTYHLQRQKKLR